MGKIHPEGQSQAAFPASDLPGKQVPEQPLTAEIEPEWQSSRVGGAADDMRLRIAASPSVTLSMCRLLLE